MFNFRMFNDVFNITDVQFQKKKNVEKKFGEKKSFNSNSHIRRTPQFWPLYAQIRVLYAQIYGTVLRCTCEILIILKYMHHLQISCSFRNTSY